MLHTFEGWFCSTKLLDFPFFAIALFCTVQFWEYCVSSCVSVIYETLKHFHMNSTPILYIDIRDNSFFQTAATVERRRADAGHAVGDGHRF